MAIKCDVKSLPQEIHSILASLRCAKDEFESAVKGFRKIENINNQLLKVIGANLPPEANLLDVLPDPTQADLPFADTLMSTLLGKNFLTRMNSLTAMMKKLDECMDSMHSKERKLLERIRSKDAEGENAGLLVLKIRDSLKVLHQRRLILANEFFKIRKSVLEDVAKATTAFISANGIGNEKYLIDAERTNGIGDAVSTFEKLNTKIRKAK